MELVISIDDKIYEEIKKRNNSCNIYMSHAYTSIYAIENGIPLPKGHGRLIDADEYKEHLHACETNGRPLHIMELDERLATVDEAPTIIEADKS